MISAVKNVWSWMTYNTKGTTSVNLTSKVTKESLEEYGKKLGWSITEPYQVYIAPWEHDFVLMDDTCSDKVLVLDALILHVDDLNFFSTDELPDETKVKIYIDGYDHTLELTVAHPI